MLFGRYRAALTNRYRTFLLKRVASPLLKIRCDRLSAIRHEDRHAYIMARKKGIESVLRRGTIYDAQLSAWRPLNTTEIQTLVELQRE